VGNFIRIPGQRVLDVAVMITKQVAYSDPPTHGSKATLV